MPRYPCAASAGSRAAARRARPPRGFTASCGSPARTTRPLKPRTKRTRIPHAGHFSTSRSTGSYATRGTSLPQPAGTARSRAARTAGKPSSARRPGRAHSESTARLYVRPASGRTIASPTSHHSWMTVNVQAGTHARGTFRCRSVLWLGRGTLHDRLAGASSARFSFSTLTRGSPSTPSVRGSIYRVSMFSTSDEDTPRARATRAS